MAPRLRVQKDVARREQLQRVRHRKPRKTAALTGGHGGYPVHKVAAMLFPCRAGGNGQTIRRADKAHALHEQLRVGGKFPGKVGKRLLLCVKFPDARFDARPVHFVTGAVKPYKKAVRTGRYGRQNKTLGSFHIEFNVRNGLIQHKNARPPR